MARYHLKRKKTSKRRTRKRRTTRRRSKKTLSWRQQLRKDVDNIHKKRGTQNYKQFMKGYKA